MPYITIYIKYILLIKVLKNLPWKDTDCITLMLLNTYIIY